MLDKSLKMTKKCLISIFAPKSFLLYFSDCFEICEFGQNEFSDFYEFYVSESSEFNEFGEFIEFIVFVNMVNSLYL